MHVFLDRFRANPLPEAQNAADFRTALSLLKSESGNIDTHSNNPVADKTLQKDLIGVSWQNTSPDHAHTTPVSVHGSILEGCCVDAMYVYKQRKAMPRTFALFLYVAAGSRRHFLRTASNNVVLPY